MFDESKTWLENERMGSHWKLPESAAQVVEVVLMEVLADLVRTCRLRQVQAYSNSISMFLDFIITSFQFDFHMFIMFRMEIDSIVYSIFN